MWVREVLSLKKMYLSRELSKEIEEKHMCKMEKTARSVTSSFQEENTLEFPGGVVA